MAVLAQTHRKAMIAKVHIAKAKLGLDDELYRATLQAVTGKRSAADCTDRELDDVLAHFARAGFHVERSSPLAGEGRVGGPLHESGPLPAAKYLAKIRALWISGWNLGIVRDRSDKAMEAFIERQTGLASARWLKSASDASKVIEALKSWLAREAEVDWGPPPPLRPAYYTMPGYKIAWAQWSKLLSLGAATLGKTWSGCDKHPCEGLLDYGCRIVGGNPQEWTNDDWIEVTRALGRKLRAALARGPFSSSTSGEVARSDGGGSLNATDAGE